MKEAKKKEIAAIRSILKTINTIKNLGIRYLKLQKHKLHNKRKNEPSLHTGKRNKENCRSL
jgi:hypothetical protein